MRHGCVRTAAGDAPTFPGILGAMGSAVPATTWIRAFRMANRLPTRAPRGVIVEVSTGFEPVYTDLQSAA